MNNSIILIDSVDEISQLSNVSYDADSLIIAFNIDVHEKLSKLDIEHKKVDEYLSDEERSKIFDKTINFYNWFLKLPSNDLQINNISLFEILDTNELHNFLIQKIRKVILIQKIFEYENPKNIISNPSLLLIIKQLIDIKQINFILFKDASNTILSWEKIEIPFIFFKKNFSIKISRNMFIKIKNFLELFLGKIFNLWYSPSKNRKSIILLEFNPLLYSDLIKSLKNDNVDIVLFNRRRPATWNFSSLKSILTSKSKILNEKFFYDHDHKNKVILTSNDYSKKLITFLNSNKNLLTTIFQIDNISFWPIIEKEFKDIFFKRLTEYISLLLVSKNIFQKMDISCIVALNNVGEVEKSILKSKSHKTPFILLEHAYADFNSSNLRYDVLEISDSIQDKIAVWGDIQKEYLINFRQFSPDKIIVTGSPRHDLFFSKKNSAISNSKISTILFTFHPIIDYYSSSTIDLFLKFKNFITEFYKIIENIPNLKIIVKLHPAQDEHSNKIKKIFYSIDKSIEIHQHTPILDLMLSSDFVIMLSPESYDVSTILMESLILEIPTMTINLDGNFNEYSCIKDNAVFAINELDNLEKDIKTFLFDKQLQIKLINNGKLHLDNFLINHGNASKSFAKYLLSL